MREIGAFEAKNTLGALLDLVSRGEEIVITRRGKPVARLVAETSIPNHDQAHKAIADMVRMRRGVTLGEGISIRSLIDEGRM